MAVIQISEADAARELPSLLDKVRAGDQVEIVREDASFVIVPVGGSMRGRRTDTIPFADLLIGATAVA